MGITSDEEGETSSHTSNSDERPLKKARYIWQIKGKYHLKTPGETDEKDKKLDLVDSVVDSGQNKSDSVVEPTCTNDHQAENQLPIPDNLSTDSISIISNDPISESLYPSYEMYRLSNTISNLELTKWQDRQVARSFVDNTINGVLEDMGFVPMPFEAEDVSDEDTVPGDYKIEDEAVLMAIHNHGLQTTEGSNLHSKRKACCSENETLLPECSCRQSTSIRNNGNNMPLPDPFHKRVLNLSPMEVESSRTYNNALHVPVTSMAGNIPTSEPISKNIANVKSSFSKDYTISEPNINKELSKTETIVDSQEETKNLNLNNNIGKQNSPCIDQNDFIDQAVAVAILKKGLSTISGTEMR